MHELIAPAILTEKLIKRMPQSTKNPQILIVGPLKLQNELLTFFLGRSTGLKCARCQEYDLNSIVETKKNPKPLILWDCLDTALQDLGNDFGLDFESVPQKCFVALFNAIPDSGIETEAMRMGVRGIFFENDPPAILIKGVQAIVDGELWYPREAMAKCFLEATRNSIRTPKNDQAILTPREKQILTMIGAGAGNDEIAEGLCISIHTVKTHIYNIYNKIKVPNRIQAALWAAKNFDA
ncbi:MAG: response regulator transcription factor [Desulfobacterales bacterium]